MVKGNRRGVYEVREPISISGAKGIVTRVGGCEVRERMLRLAMMLR